MRRLAMVAAVGLMACADGQSVLHVVTRSDGQLGGVAALRVMVHRGAEASQPVTVRPAGAPVVIAADQPLAFSLVLEPDHTGDVMVHVAALDAGGASITEAVVAATVKPSEVVEVPVVLPCPSAWPGCTPSDMGLDLPPSDLGPDLSIWPPLNLVTHAQITAWCMALGPCNVLGTGGLSACLRTQPMPGTITGFAPSTFDCLGTVAGDCDAAHACLAKSASWQCNADAGTQPACASGTFSVCSGGYRVALPCTEMGLGCIGTANPNYSGCGFDTCVAGSPRDCRDSLLSACNAGGRRYLAEDCRVFDSEVCETPDAGAACAGTGPACTQDSCDGSVLVDCKGGRQARFDCQRLGLTCVDKGGGAVSCGLALDCDPASYLETCSGAVLHYCDLGRVKTVDCVAAGWKRCVPRAIPDGGSTLSGGRCGT